MAGPESQSSSAGAAVKGFNRPYLNIKHRRNEEILGQDVLGEAKLDPITMIMRRLEWFDNGKRRLEIESNEA